MGLHDRELFIDLINRRGGTSGTLQSCDTLRRQNCIDYAEAILRFISSLGNKTL